MKQPIPSFLFAPARGLFFAKNLIFFLKKLTLTLFALTRGSLMPFIRTPKGVKMPFSSAKIAELISSAYTEVYRKNSYQHRGEINKLTKEIIRTLEKKYGNSPETEWDYFNILSEIEKLLSKNTQQRDVYYAFFDFFQHEKEKSNDKDKKIIKTTDNFKTRKEFDPAWNIYIRRMETDEEFQLRVRQNELSGKETGYLTPRDRRSQVSLRRSAWLKCWTLLCEQAKRSFDHTLFLNEIEKERNTISLNIEDWYNFWQDFVFSKLVIDPRIYTLLSVIEIRQMRTKIIGGNWLLYTGLNIENYYDQNDQINLDYFHKDIIKNTYSILFKQFLTTILFADHMKQDLLQGFDLEALSAAIDPDRDTLLDWRGIQHLKQSGSLQEIPLGTQWKLNDQVFTTKENCHELPQWAYMRLAIAIASIEKEEDKTKKAIDFYNLFSLQNIIPTATMLREAGKAIPDYLEDQASIVPDKYENIWESIHKTAINTKWTGTVSLDWRQVRAKDSPINNGMRFSSGILPFLETINTSLNAQERSNDDKPVTNIIPVYHKDSTIFIDSEKHSLKRFNSVISLSDLFMERAKNAETWTMFDPKIYPEVLDGSRNSYLLAESKIKERSRKYPKSYKQKRADKILNKLLRNMQNGEINIVFESNNRAFNVYQKELAQVNGIEGVGSFIVHNNQEKGMTLYSHWASWPSLAVNISHIINDKGAPDLNKMKFVISNSLLILDNAIFLSQKNDYGKQDEKNIMANRDINDFRHVCLGIIGLNETIEDLKEKRNLKTENEIDLWLRALTSSWQTIILSEEKFISNKRGVADIYGKMPYKDYFNPVKSIANLRKSRDGSFGITLTEKETKHWTDIYTKLKNTGHRFLSKSIYAPFTLPSAIAGVTPGGLGIIMPTEKVFDLSGKSYWVPTSLLLRLINKNPDLIREYAKVMKYPTDHKKWHSDIRQYSHPSPEDWRKIMLKSSQIRSWFDQGVCLTLPTGIQKDQLSNIFEQAWFYGISSVRFTKRDLDNEDHENSTEEHEENNED